jgi:hypothetical protein
VFYILITLFGMLLAVPDILKYCHCGPLLWDNIFALARIIEIIGIVVISFTSRSPVFVIFSLIALPSLVVRLATHLHEADPTQNLVPLVLGFEIALVVPALIFGLFARLIANRTPN